LLQLIEKSTDLILLIGVARVAHVSTQTSGISFHFVIRAVLYQTKHCSSVKICGTSKQFGLAMSLALLSSLCNDSNLQLSVFE